MKNILLLLLLFTGIAHGQIVNIPDANFKAKIISLGYDSNLDNEIQNSEISDIGILELENSSIENLTGIEAFVNLNTLRCGGNQITNLDVTNLSQLIILECDNNPITSLNINGLTNLTFLGCAGTLITELDFSSNPNFNFVRAMNCIELISINAYGMTNFSCDIQGSINIQHLNLHGCNMDGQILEFYLNQMVNLITLDIAGIQGIRNLGFGGTFLDITGCTSLEQLFVYGPTNSLDISSFVNLTDLILKNGSRTSLDLTGLNNLRYLNCSDNQLTNLILPLQNNLTDVRCENNQLSNINTSFAPMLEILFVNSNSLSNLDLSGNNNLTVLNCGNNQITSLNVSNLSQLNSLSIDNNTISTLDISNNPLLYYLSIIGSQIDTINLSNNPLIGNFRFENTFIQSIDLSSFTNLTFTSFGSDSLLNLNLKNGKNENVTFTTSPNLQFICADELQIANLQTLVPSNTVVSSYCSFIPGGDYNTVTGVVKWDSEDNGCDSSDSNFPYNTLMLLSNGTSSSGTFLNVNGNYTLYAETGNYTLTPQLEQPTYFNINPTSATFNFPTLDNATQTENFCLTPNGFHPDLEVIITPIGVARPGFNSYYKIVYKNKGNQQLDGIVNLTFDDARTDLISSVPITDNQQVGSLTWNFNNLHPFETRTIDFILNLNTPLENPALNNGDILNFITTTSSVIGEGTSYDNTFELNQTIVNSYDPNDKTCLEGNTITPESIGKYVHYNINFENIGTANAVNIVVKDIIDTTKFDVNSLQLLYASHAVETKISGNKVEFIFKNINLPSSIQNPIGGHGNVLFKIKTLPTLVVGDEVSNTANIFFDYNAPIQTNEARTTIATLSKDDFTKDETITIAPNPARNTITVSSKNKLKSVLLFDVQGRLLQTVLEHNKTTTLDISNQASGVYFLKVITEVGSSVEKIVKE